ncbi:MAG: Cys-tRNA(Pro) deacylase [Lachnospiraceae bacterium]|nr:Cys-tRNA(Pro) deacylase [Lachnospiraceae bacterium]
MGKEVKTNAMRILDRHKIQYKLNTYNCENFVDGKQIADMLGQDYNISFKTLVAVGKSRQYYVFAIPVAEELDLKQAAKEAGEKSIALVHVKDINKVTGYIRGGCTPIGMKKQFPTFVHESAKEFDRIIISGGRLGTQIFLNPLDLLEVTGGKYADLIVH